MQKEIRQRGLAWEEAHTFTSHKEDLPKAIFHVHTIGNIIWELVSLLEQDEAYIIAYPFSNYLFFFNDVIDTRVVMNATVESVLLKHTRRYHLQPQVSLNQTGLKS